MEPEFWHNKWETNEIGFHNESVHPLLAQHVATLSLSPTMRLFLPLCGKTRDIAWLVEQGYRVVGIELSQLAVEQLFSELALSPEVIENTAVTQYRASQLDIFVGDIFNLRAEHIGQVDAIYDRAALVALPYAMRQKYTSHLIEITQSAPQLLIAFDYDQSLMNGPPFSVIDDEIHQHYASTYAIEQIDAVDVEGGLKGRCPAKEMVWLLR
jgi:thiopurine S-methyltransferase